MKIYRLTLQTAADSSMGFVFTSNRARAHEAATDFHRREAGNDPETKVEPLNCPTDKAGLIRFLNRYASHPDNG